MRLTESFKDISLSKLNPRSQLIPFNESLPSNNVESGNLFDLRHTSETRWFFDFDLNITHSSRRFSTAAANWFIYKRRSSIKKARCIAEAAHFCEFDNKGIRFHLSIFIHYLDIYTLFRAFTHQLIRKIDIEKEKNLF